jgi:DNA-directed RNA polymerase subunit M/transcription elongation factor TFIIS
MKINFCPKCKGIIIPRNCKNETLMLCNSCGWFKIIKGKINLKSNEKIKKEKIGEGIKKFENEFATYEFKCSKCGYNKAQVIDAGIFYSDEDNLILLQCGNSERIGDKTT